MHRSLQALQYYTSHSETEIERLHERIRLSLVSTESLTDTMIRLTGQAPLVPIQEDTVTAEDWTVFLSGRHHPALADFYGTLVARPILEEDGPAQELETESVPSLSRTHREPDASRRQKNKSVPDSRPRRHFPWRWIALLILCFLLGAGGTYVYSNYIASPRVSETESTVEKPVAVNDASTETPVEDQPEVTQESNILYVKTRNSNIYSDSGLTDLLYEADFGDGYRILETTATVSKIEVTEELIGYINNADTTKTLQEDVIADESLLTWINENLDTQFVTEAFIDLIGKSSTDLNSLYGEPERTFSDEVNSYLFYGTYFFTLQNDVVIAIDWSETAITNAELATLAPLQLETETTGLVTSNSYRLQRFEQTGKDVSRIRLAEQRL